MLVVLVVCVAFALVLGYELISSIPAPRVQQGAGPTGCPEASPVACPACPTIQPLAAKRVDLRLPAVDRQKRGAFANLSVEVGNGDGRVFVRMDAENPLINPETQNSLRTAIHVARQVTGIGLEDKNLYYSIAAPSDVVGGKSAGAAVAVATIAVLRGEQLRSDAVITGTIEANGSIGQVGEILAKAVAAKEAGYLLFLVPVGEGTVWKQVEKCEKTQQTIEGGVVIREVCRITSEAVNVSQEVGIQIIEVGDVSKAYALMKK